MNGLEILAIVTPILGCLFMGILVFVTTYLDDKAAEAERKARASAAE
jgi:hypothetical protein